MAIYFNIFILIMIFFNFMYIELFQPFPNLQWTELCKFIFSRE